MTRPRKVHLWGSTLIKLLQGSGISTELNLQSAVLSLANRFFPLANRFSGAANRFCQAISEMRLPVLSPVAAPARTTHLAVARAGGQRRPAVNDCGLGVPAEFDRRRAIGPRRPGSSWRRLGPGRLGDEGHELRRVRATAVISISTRAGSTGFHQSPSRFSH